MVDQYNNAPKAEHKEQNGQGVVILPGHVQYNLHGPQAHNKQ
jgi:hypothetical protein